MAGVEPTHPKALPPEDSVSTSFTTWADKTAKLIILKKLKRKIK